jgi:hypothetical protein
VPLGNLVGPQGHRKRTGFFGYANAGLQAFEAIDGSIGHILAPIVSIWSQNGSQQFPQSLSKNYSKTIVQ